MAVSTIPSCQSRPVRLMPSRRSSPSLRCTAQVHRASGREHQLAPSDSKRVTRPNSVHVALHEMPAQFLHRRERAFEINARCRASFRRNSFVAAFRRRDRRRNSRPRFRRPSGNSRSPRCCPILRGPRERSGVYADACPDAIGTRPRVTCRSNDSIVPTYSTSPVNIVQISLDCEINAKLAPS